MMGNHNYTQFRTPTTTISATTASKVNPNKIDPETLAALTTRMSKLWIQREAPPNPWSAIYGRQRYSTILHLITDYHTLCSWHLMHLVYWPMKRDSKLSLYYNEMKAMVTAGWLERERMPERKDDAYSLGEWGRLLARINSRKASNRRALRGHDLLTADFMTECLRRARDLDGLTTWESEREARLTDQLHPDAILKLNIAGTTLDGFIEADTGSEDLGIFADKYYKYLSYYNNGDWRERFHRASFPITLVITKGKWDRIAGMRAALANRIETTGSRLLFYLTSESALHQTMLADTSAGPIHEPIWLLPDEEGERSIWQLLQSVVNIRKQFVGQERQKDKS